MHKYMIIELLLIYVNNTASTKHNALNKAMALSFYSFILLQSLYMNGAILPQTLSSQHS